MNSTGLRIAAALSLSTAFACGQVPAGTDAAQNATAKRTVPPEVRDFEAQAEDAYDVAFGGDVAGVQTAAASMAKLWKTTLRRMVDHDGLSDASLHALDGSLAQLSSLSATSKDNVALARAANAVTGTMDDVVALYHPKVPPTIITLDFLGRELVLDCAKGSDLRAAWAHLRTLKAEWLGLRPKVLQVGGKDQAAGVDDALSGAASALAAHDWPGLLKQAQAELELVDAIEHHLPW
jgi:hypothetical protein